MLRPKEKFMRAAIARAMESQSAGDYGIGAVIVKDGEILVDMIDHRKKNGNTEWTWRTIDIPAATVLAQGEPKLDIVGGFMRDECLKLFHS